LISYPVKTSFKLYKDTGGVKGIKIIKRLTQTTPQKKTPAEKICRSFNIITQKYGWG